MKNQNKPNSKPPQTLSQAKELIQKLEISQAKLKLKNRQLRKKESYLSAIISTIGIPVFVKDHESKVILANDSFCTIFKLSIDQIIGKTLAENVPKKERELFFKVDQNVLTSGIKNICEETLTLQGEPPLTIITTKTRYTDSKGRHFLIGVISDITKYKNLELELDHKANTDYLTGINNRGHFMELAKRELKRSIRQKTSISLLMMDIDFFKRVNDTYGHKAGDIVLKKLAEVSKETIREVDLIGRVGGEEFAVLLPDTNKDAAIELAKRLLTTIENLEVHLNSNDLPIKFTVSIGLTSVTSKKLNLDELLMLSDKALYKAKNSGRNKVCTAFQ